MTTRNLFVKLLSLIVTSHNSFPKDRSTCKSLYNTLNLVKQTDNQNKGNQQIKDCKYLGNLLKGVGGKIQYSLGSFAQGLEIRKFMVNAELDQKIIYNRPSIHV